MASSSSSGNGTPADSVVCDPFTVEFNCIPTNCCGDLVSAEVTGSSGSEISVACCPGVLLPNVLTVSLAAPLCSSSSSSSVATECCPDDLIPSALQVTFSNGTGTCSCFDGKTFGLTWDGTDWSLSPRGDICVADDPGSITLGCKVGNWNFNCSGTCDVTNLGPPDIFTCSPFQLFWAGQIVGNTSCCSDGLGQGTVDITITE